MTSLNLEYLYYQIYRLLTGQIGGGFFERLVVFSAKIAPFSVIISLVLLVGIVYCLRRLYEIKREMISEHGEVGRKPVTDMPNKRWSRIINHLNSDNESDWRLAVLEADLILEDMLNSMGYAGETIGEKLKGIERSDFNTIDKAWEAHKIRNLIAHEGGNYRIDNRAARGVVSLYEQVFREFHFI
jgi:hypothetical protein